MFECVAGPGYCNATPIGGDIRRGNVLNILINESGWQSIGESMPPDEIVERLGMTADAVDRVLKGETRPDSVFVAASLASFPMQFSDLFDVMIKH